MFDFLKRVFGQKPNSNDAVRSAIRSAGHDPAESYKIEHFAYFKSQPAVNAFTAEIGNKGFSLQQSNSEFGVVFTRVDSPESAEFDALTTELEQLASKHDGEYDGWGVPLT